MLLDRVAPGTVVVAAATAMPLLLVVLVSVVAEPPPQKSQKRELDMMTRQVMTSRRNLDSKHLV